MEAATKPGRAPNGSSDGLRGLASDDARVVSQAKGAVVRQLKDAGLAEQDATAGAEQIARLVKKSGPASPKVASLISELKSKGSRTDARRETENKDDEPEESG